MKNFKRNIFLPSVLFFVILLPFFSFSQDSLQIKTLESVDVRAKRKAAIKDYLRETGNSNIYAGKKTDVINVDKIDGNKATNQSRQIFNRVPGIHIWESDASGIQLGISVRGLNPNRTSEFNSRQNGYDISADALGYPESYYTPQTEGIEQIEIIRGASSLQFGSQFGGLLNYVMKRPPANPFEIISRNTIGSYGLFNSFSSIGGTKGNFEYYGFFDHKQGNSWRNNSGFNINSGYVHAGIGITPTLKISFEYTKMHYTAQQPGGLTDVQFRQDPRQSIRSRNWFGADWNIFALLLDYKISERTTLNVRNFVFSGERGSVGDLSTANKIDTLGNRDILFDNYLNIGHETRLMHQYNAGSLPSTLLVGLRYYHGDTHRRQGFGTNGYDANFSYNHPENLEGSDFTFPSGNAAFFAENIFRIDSQLKIIPGVRFEHIRTASEGYYNQFGTRINENKSSNRSFLIAGLGLSYQLKKSTELYANFSQGYRAINFNDLRIVNPSQKVDPALKDARGYTVDLGVRGSLNKYFRFDAGVYFLKYNNRIGDVLVVDSLFNIYQLRTNVADARSMGAEGYAEWDAWKMYHPNSKLGISLFLSAAVTDARYVENKQTGIKKNNKVELAPPVIARGGIHLQYKNISSSIQYAYTGKQFSDATNANTSPVGTIGVVPAYSVADFNNRVTFEHFAFEFGVNNFLNKKYFTRRSTSYPGPGIISAEPINFYIAAEIKF